MTQSLGLNEEIVFFYFKLALFNYVSQTLFIITFLLSNNSEHTGHLLGTKLFHSQFIMQYESNTFFSYPYNIMIFSNFEVFCEDYHIVCKSVYSALIEVKTFLFSPLYSTFILTKPVWSLCLIN